MPDLYRYLAACDLAIVQGGLTTTMELTATRRPFLYFPLRHHFEQQFHVRAPARPLRRRPAHGLRRSHPGQLAVAIAAEIGRPVTTAGRDRRRRPRRGPARRAAVTVRRRAPAVVIPVVDRLDVTGRHRGAVARPRVATKRSALFDNGSGRPPGSWLERADRRRHYRAWSTRRCGRLPDVERGCRWPAAPSPVDVAILNNDLVLGRRFLVTSANAALQAAPDLWAVSPNYDGRPIAGVERAPRPSSTGAWPGSRSWSRPRLRVVRFDEALPLVVRRRRLRPQVRARQTTGSGIVGDVAAPRGGGSRTITYTADVVCAIERDRRRMWAKWRHFSTRLR